MSGFLGKSVTRTSDIRFFKVRQNHQAQSSLLDAPSNRGIPDSLDQASLPLTGDGTSAPHPTLGNGCHNEYLTFTTHSTHTGRHVSHASRRSVDLERCRRVHIQPHIDSFNGEMF